MEDNKRSSGDEFVCFLVSLVAVFCTSFLFSRKVKPIHNNDSWIDPFVSQ